jgi:predicted RND superfamily exporter protein
LSKIFGYIVRHPALIVAISLLPVLAGAYFLPGLEKDIRSDAFLADDNPALVYKQKVKEQFGLGDPLIVAIVDDSPTGVFNTAALELLQNLSDQIADLPNINESRVTSLATEKRIAATPDGMEIEPFFTTPPESDSELAELRDAVRDQPLFLGTLISEDGRVALIIAEMHDESLAGQSYRNIQAVVRATPTPADVTVHVTGEGAIIGYLGEYVDADAQKLIPLCGLVILLILVVAYRAVAPALYTGVIVLATLAITIGAMAAANIAFYVITNALPVILIGISVADAIHIYMHYFDSQAERPDASVSELVTATLEAMWRPITLTSLTTAAGFLGLYAAAYMPPFRYFGLFAAIGVMVAWYYSLVFLPALMVLVKPRASRKYITMRSAGGPSAAGSFLSIVGKTTLSHPRSIIGGFLLLVCAGFYAATGLVVDENPLRVFHHDEPIVRADEVVNRHLDGTNTLDIVIETEAAEDLFEPRNLRKMELLQSFLDGQPQVGGSISIVDYLKQMNRSLNGGNSEAYDLPESKEAIAQYFLIYSATSDPTDFEEEVDYDYRTANIRAYIKSGDYQDVKVIVENLNEYIATNLAHEGLTATPSGRVYIHYRWISDLARSHFRGLVITLALVFLMAALLFRSLVAGLLTLVPVAGAVLLVYAAMAVTKTPLGMGTSMFAAVAVGLGIDYAIHTLERIRSICRAAGGDLQSVLADFYASTARALLFNFLAISCGFAILTVSKISSLNSFGAMVVLAVTTSFLASIVILPALIFVIRPTFIFPTSASAARGGQTPPYCWLGFAALAAGWAIASSPPVNAQTLANPAPAEKAAGASSRADSDRSGSVAVGHPPVPESPETVGTDTGEITARKIVENVNAVPEGDFVTRKINMKMIDRRGKERGRQTISYRRNFDDQKRTVLFYLEPANVRNTAFLIWDYADPLETDDQWLYIPALRKVRRISAADRGDYFLGTDFTYEDTKLDGKLEPADYNFTLLGTQQMSGALAYQLEATPRTDDIAKELGYSRFHAWVDASNWMVVRVEFWDTKNKPLKTLTVSDIRQVDGIWTRHELLLENHQTEHKTHYLFSDVDYASEVKESWFTKRALERGH